MHGETLIQLIVPEGLMLRKFSQVGPQVQTPGNLAKTNHQPYAGSIRKEHVAKTKTMRTVGKLTYMFVPCVLKMVNLTLTPQKIVGRQKTSKALRHCSTNNSVNQQRFGSTVINSTRDCQGSVYWRANYYRFLGRSYADVVKCTNTKKGAILCNNGLVVKSHSSADKHADNTRVYNQGCDKKVSVILKPSSVVCKQSHVDNVRIQVSTPDMHSKHIDTHCGYENKDGMVVSRYFTENKFSLLENDSSSHSVDNNGERYDNKVEICNVCDSISTASRKVGQKPYSVTEKCNTNNVVSHIGKSRHKVAPASVVHCNTSSSQTSVTSDSKYDLSLSGRPNNRARINNAISNSTFRLWDGQNSQKFGFIPTSDLIIPSNNK